MKVPSIQEAERLLEEAAKLCPGRWVDHNRVAGLCARKIAEKCKDMDPDAAYVMGLLHDIGRREGGSDMTHIYAGYVFMNSLGYTDSARICLTHSYPFKLVASYNGINDRPEEENEFVQNYIDSLEYDDYDKLIQLCDALALPEGPTFIEKRLVDVAMRHGINEYSLTKWKAFFEVKEHFDKKTGVDIYTLIGV